MPDREVLLTARAAAVTRAAVLARYRPDSCITTTRVLIEVLRYFGVSAEPWAVDLTVTNAAGRKWAATDVPIEDWPDEAYSIGMRADSAARPGDGGQFGVGHVVAVVAGGLMADASIDQVARPGHGIPALAPVLARLPGDWRDAPDGMVLRWAAGDGDLQLDYRGNGSRLYASSPNWRRRNPHLRACVAEAIRAVRG
jgi:hypothetical protein